MIDNSIITKFELSEREKVIKAKHFGKKNDALPKQDTSNRPNYNRQEKHPDITDEAVNKMIEDNLNNIRASEFSNGIQTGNINRGGSSQQMNIVYTQNKLMERNMDILQETQRSLHDLLLYNMRKDGAVSSAQQFQAIKHQQGLNQKKINEILSPIYSSIDAIKTEIKQVTSANTNQPPHYPSSTSTEALNMKVNEMVSMNNNLKHKQEAKMKYSLDLIEQNKKNYSQNSTVMKAISELKTTLTSMNKEMSGLETVFQDKLSKIIQDNQKNQLNSIANISSSNPIGRDSNKKQDLNITSKHLKNIDYSEYKNDLLEINLQKEALISDFKNNAPALKALVKPKEKIDFNYIIDYSSTANESFSSNELNKSRSNVFNQNWNSSQCLKQHKKQQQQQRQNQQLKETNSKQIQSTSVGSNPNIPNQRISHIENEENQIKQSRMSQQHQQQVFNNQSSSYNNNMVSSSQNNNQENELKNLSIADKMLKYQEKMNQIKSKIPMTSSKDHHLQPQSDLIIVQGPSNEEITVMNQPSGEKSAKANQFMQKEQLAPPNITIIDPPKKKQFSVGLFPTDYVPPMSISRDDMTMVQVALKEKDRRVLIEDVVLRLCLDKMVKDKPIQSMNQPIPINPYNFSDEDVKNLTTNMIEDYIKSIIRNTKKKQTEFSKTVEPSLQIIPSPPKGEVKEKEAIIIQPKESNKEVRVIEREIIHNNIKDNSSQMEELMKLLIEKFGGIETALNKIKIPISNNNNQRESDIAREITEKIKSDMKININLKGGQSQGQRHQPQPQPQRNIPFYSFGHSSFIVNAKNQPKEEKEASHLFESTQKIEMNALDELIQQPHMINLADYDVSSVSSFVSESKATLGNPNQSNNKRDLNDTSNSLSKGQIVTDQSQSQEDDSIANSKNKIKSKTGLDLLLLGNYNENIPLQAINFTHEKDNEMYYQDDGISQIDRNEEDESMSSINKREIVGIDDNNKLKQMHLFESNEYQNFKRNYPNTYSGSNSGQPMLLSFGTTMKATHEQMRSNQYAEDKDNNAFTVKLPKVSNEDIAKLNRKEHLINEKLKHLVNMTNNTISENSDLNQQNTNEDPNSNSKVKKSYKTDQSSSS